MQNEPEIWTSAVASSYYDLESKTIKLKRILDNPTLLVFHEIYDLRTAMLNVSPGAKTVKVLDMLINYEQKYENGSNIIKFDDAFKFELYNMVLELMTKLDHWHDFLFVRKHGVDDFGVIKNNIDNELSRINAKMDYLKQWIFDDELKQIKTEIDLLLPSKQHDFNDFEPKPKPKPESE